MQGMQREQQCHYDAGPPGAGRAVEEQKQDDRRQAVEQRVDQVHRAAVQPEELIIEHVRETRDWEPVGGFDRRERPLDSGSVMP